KSAIANIGLKVKGRVLLMKRVVIAACEVRAHFKVQGSPWIHDAPGQHHQPCVVLDDNLMRDANAVAHRELPRRPRMRSTSIDSRDPVGGKDAWLLGLGGNRESAAGRARPRVDATAQTPAAGWGPRRGERERVLPARAHAAGRAGRKTAEAV